MRESWLKSNRRALAIGLLLPVLLGSLGICIIWSVSKQGAPFWCHWLAWPLTLLSVWLAALLLMGMRQPRLAYEEGYILAFLRSSEPIRVPIEVIECFFLGQAPASGVRGREKTTSTLIVRLAESAEEWHFRETKNALGHWCDGYITIYGTWCEPLCPRLLDRMNKRLAEEHRRLRTGKKI